VADPAVVVLSSEDYGSIDDLLAVRRAIAALVLYRVRPGELDRVLPSLREGDDVCLVDDPQLLVDYRLHAMARRAGVDPMTGFLDRASFARAASAALPIALLVTNLDHFKRFNDHHGHMVGDELLREAGARIRSAVPGDALVARIGGDSFAVALAAHHDPRGTAAAIRAAIDGSPLHAEGTTTVSIGLAVRTAEASYDDLLDHAEGALYAAKARGRDRIVDHAERERAARERDGHLELESFEEMTRVLTERVADVIAERGRRVFQSLRDQADVDALTGLATRRYLDRRLPFELAQARERGRPLSIGLLDVDHFGRVNKEHGWPTGDKILADTSARIREALRASDWAARYGGEEICVVLEGVTGDAARAALERVRAAVGSKPFTTTQGEPLVITVSIGCAELEADDTTSQLIERASARLLVAKREGRDQVR
jgi:two-component system cell cycle response regulator